MSNNQKSKEEDAKAKAEKDAKAKAPKAIPLSEMKPNSDMLEAGIDTSKEYKKSEK